MGSVSKSGEHLPVTRSALAAVCDEPDAYIEKLSQSSRQSPSSADGFISWAYQHSHVRVSEEPVPDGILPEGLSATLADVKVNCRGPDDIAYDNDPELRQKVARGNTFLRLDGGQWQCVIYALKKFSGGMGDDDDRTKGGDDFVWKRYFTKDICEASSVISLKKANGEAAHLSCVKIHNVHYIVTGSKNVHLIIRKKSDIQKYSGPRYRYACEIAEAILDFMAAMAKQDVIRLLDFLAETRLTVVLEILNPNHQHVEDLSYLGDKCALKFITWTSTNVDAEDELCILPPDVSIKLANHLGFDPVMYNEISAVEAETHMLQIRQQYGFEGEVFYYLDAQRNVIGLLKKKTAWYIICRAIRERVRNALSCTKTFDQKETEHRIFKRIGQIQTWLHLCNSSTLSWKKLGSDYLNWVVQQQKLGKVTPQDVADKFPVTWTRFLKETKSSDAVEYTNSEAADHT